MRHDRGDILAGRLDDLRWEVLIIFQPRQESGCDHSKQVKVHLMNLILVICQEAMDSDGLAKPLN